MTHERPLPDGKYVVYKDTRKATEGFWLKPVGEGTSGAAKQILSAEYVSSANLSSSWRYLLYRDANGEIWRMALPEGKPERLPDLFNDLSPASGTLRMSRDDKQVVFLKQRWDSRIVLIENVFK